MIHLVRLLTGDGTSAKAAETSQSIWGQTKLEIMQLCRAKNKLLPLVILFGQICFVLILKLKQVYLNDSIE
jgi:hypothetical protein